MSKRYNPQILKPFFAKKAITSKAAHTIKPANCKVMSAAAFLKNWMKIIKKLWVRINPPIKPAVTFKTRCHVEEKCFLFAGIIRKVNFSK